MSESPGEVAPGEVVSGEVVRVSLSIISVLGLCLVL